MIIVVLITLLILFLAYCAWHFLPGPLNFIGCGLLVFAAIIYFVEHLDTFNCTGSAC